MRLDHNCVRDVLLLLESEPYVITNGDGDIEFTGVWLPQICEKLPQYSQEVIFYTISKLNEGGYIDISADYAENSLSYCCVNFITYSGHEFLETIKPDTVWKKTVGIAGQIGNFGLKMLEKIAEGVATAYFKEILLGD